MLTASVIEVHESISGLCRLWLPPDFLNMWAVNALGDSSMYSIHVALYVYLMLKRHLAYLALEMIPFFDIGQVLPLEVLR